ncbi:MAG: alpha/beta hydrolase [Proteobacteria bacterium]|nr:alpha/beta hydrolase [Pseudomonadota bacterium]MCP4918843.1 alpha/beta hydrolase [Pseudomonadota bacterium]
MASQPPLPEAPLSQRPEPLRLPQPRDLVKTAARAALAGAYRGLQKDKRDKFAKAPEREPLSRVYYRTDDGWQAPLFRVEPLPGAPGEPVLLAHGLGTNRFSLDYAPELSLARSLRARGFAVYLFEHRGDRSAIAPPHAGAWDFDDLATRDLPAAIDQIRAHSGFRRVLYVGHGLGGQLLYAHLAHSRGEDVAAATCISAPVRFRSPPSNTRALRLASLLLPGGLRVPAHAANVLRSPTLDGTAHTDGEIRRGWMLHATEDVSVGLLRQVLRWLEAGSLVDRHDRVDYAAACHGVRTPVQLVTSWGDSLCRPDDATPVLEHLSGPSELVELDASWSGLDPLVGRDAPTRVHPDVARWLARFRRDCW